MAIFVDTVYWLALINPADRWRSAALERAASIAEPLVTTEAVLTEIADALCRPDHRRWAVEAIRSIREDDAIVVAPGSAELFERGYALYAERPDKSWSLTDCMSFVVMRDRGIDRALTADLHFVQAGFRALLRDP